MKRGGPLKRKTAMSRGSGFARPGPAKVERAPATQKPTTNYSKNYSAPTVRTLHRGVAPVFERDVVTVAKTSRKENPRLLRMAKARACLLCVPGVCNRDPGTTVACHSNWREYGGKAARRKADDFWVVAGCFACHTWLDQGRASNEEKQAAFLAGHRRQRAAWQHIADDPREHEADREAARWALASLAEEAQPANDTTYTIEGTR